MAELKTAQVAPAKRFFLFLWTTLQLVSWGPMQQKWVAHWAAQRTSILILTVVNTSITAGTEMMSRSIVASKADQHFIVINEKGHKQIHRQSLLNILMTIFATLIGSPVYFFIRRRHRFAFFILFGGFNSLLSQMVGSLLREGFVHLILPRLIFDLAYNGSVKYALFEFVRPKLLHYRHKIVQVSALRLSQDFLTTLFRVATLNALGFK